MVKETKKINKKLLINRNEVEIVTSIYGFGFKRNGFRRGKAPSILIGYYKGNDIIQFIIQMKQEEENKILMSEKKSMKDFRILNMNQDGNGGFVMECEIDYIEEEDMSSNKENLEDSSSKEDSNKAEDSSSKEEMEVKKKEESEKEESSDKETKESSFKSKGKDKRK
jgi:hypothetical protein